MGCGKNTEKWTETCFLVIYIQIRRTAASPRGYHFSRSSENLEEPMNDWFLYIDR